MKPVVLGLMLALCAACHRMPASPPVSTAPSSAAAADPPARVARLSYLAGAVSLRSSATAEWSAAERNRPLTTGDALWTDRDGRAELHFGSTALRLDHDTEIALLEVGSSAIQVKVSTGTVSLHVRDLEEGEEIEIATPQVAVLALRTGRYRIEVAPDGAATRVTTRTGTAELAADGLSAVVRAEQQAEIPGATGARYTVSPAPAADAFDTFCLDRARREDLALAAKNVSSGVIGYEDLADHGEWRQAPAWGAVWMPRVPAGWVPYRFGHWIWLEPWGWTWIDDAPWGFAPFHYGRWLIIEARWCWIPGPFHRRPVWAPALVVFAGNDGFRFHVRIAAGVGVAWFPLGPREVWLPPYRASRRYVTQVNITHTTILNETQIHSTNIYRQRYANRDAPQAITAMPRDPFVRSQPAQRHAAPVAVRDLRIGGSAPPLAPTPESLGRRGEQPTVRPPDSADRRPVVVRRAPPAQPERFEQRRSAVDSSAGRVPPAAATEGARSQPEYRRVPQPAPTTPRAGEVRPPTQQRQDRQWEQRTRQDEAQRKQRIESERRREPAMRGGQSGSSRESSGARERKPPGR